jgi:flap endonuclease-1
MAVDLSKLVSKRKLSFDELRGRVIAIDAFNVLYQFLSIIRQPDGTPLMDAHGNVTSHLSGIFYRTIEILDYGIKPIYIFDGLPSVLKQRTIAARMKRREGAFEAWQKAKKEGDIEAIKTYAQASTRIDDNIIASAKELLEHMGVGYMNAPGEGEAQASYMCRKGLVYAAASQDYDTLLFGSKVVVRNLTFSGRRKLPRRNVYINVEPEIVSLDDTLNSLGINQKQLIWLGILLGTDFNKGIRGVGPKTALKITKTASKIEDIKDYVKEKYNEEFELDISEVEDLFLKPEVEEVNERQVESLLQRQYDKEKIVSFMCRKHGFSEERISKYIDKLARGKADTKQKGIGNWFK